MLNSRLLIPGANEKLVLYSLAVRLRWSGLEAAEGGGMTHTGKRVLCDQL